MSRLRVAHLPSLYVRPVSTLLFSQLNRFLFSVFAKCFEIIASVFDEFSV